MVTVFTDEIIHKNTSSSKPIQSKQFYLYPIKN